MVKIESHNQRGGITANNVNLYSKIKEHKDKNLTKRIIAIIFILAAIVAILGYMNINPFSKKDKEGTVSVTSYNQQGGITANQVNIGNQPRKLNPQLMNQIEQMLQVNKNKTVKVTAVLGDGEAFQFANEIKIYLESKGWNVDGVDQAIYSQPTIGQSITPDGREIIIGSKS